MFCAKPLGPDRAEAIRTIGITVCGIQLATVETQMIKLRSCPAEAGTGPGAVLLAGP